MSQAALERTPIVDRNGKQTTVLRKSSTKDGRAGGRSDKLAHHLNPVARELDASIQQTIKDQFPKAVEFRFDFQTDGESLHFFDRAVVDKSGELITDGDKLDIISNRLAEAYYETGAFGSRDIVRLSSVSDYGVAIRLE